jgi:hypothetical protein
VSPNKSLQRSGTHKVLGRGRPSAETAHGHWRARVLKGRRAVAELGRYAPRLATTVVMLLVAFCAIAAQSTTKPAELLHAFVVDGQVIGYLYGDRVPEAQTRPLAAWSRLEIRSATSASYRVLYRIERTGLYLASGQLDIGIGDDGSRGFYLSVQRPDYITIDCCKLPTKEGRTSAMDSITIEWNRDLKRFEMFKTP